MGDGGFIKLHRKIMEWEWYDDVNTCRVFVHLLLSANHRPERWHGIDIAKGQRLTSITRLSDETSLSERAVRTSLNHLKATREVTIQTTHRYTLITLLKWDVYQLRRDECDTPNDTPNDEPPTSRRHADDKPPTTNKKDKKERREEGKKNLDALAPLDAAFVGFKEMREKSRKKLTAKAEQMIRTKLEQLAPGDESKQVEILDQSTMNGWASVYPLSDGSKTKASAPRRPSNAGNFEQREYSDEYLGSLYDELPPVTAEYKAEMMAQAEKLQAERERGADDDDVPPPEEET